MLTRFFSQLSIRSLLKAKGFIINRFIQFSFEENEYYFSDLIGLEVVDLEDNVIGKVKSVDNFGAGDVMEIVIKGERSVVLPFSIEAIPIVDTLNGRVTVNLPDELNLDVTLDAVGSL